MALGKILGIVSKILGVSSPRRLMTLSGFGVMGIEACSLTRSVDLLSDPPGGPSFFGRLKGFFEMEILPSGEPVVACNLFSVCVPGNPNLTQRAAGIRPEILAFLLFKLEIIYLTRLFGPASAPNFLQKGFLSGV